MNTHEINELVNYWDLLTTENSRKRTALTSGLIPVREYTSYVGFEAWLRWPDIYRRLDEAVGAAELGAQMRGPGTSTTNAHPFALAVIPFGGWRGMHEMSKHGLLEQVDDVRDRVAYVLDFWRRFVEPWRADGFRSCWDAADSLRTCDAPVVAALADAAVPVEGEDANLRARRFVAGLQQYLFLLYLDTRLGTGDSGPYPLPNGRTMIVREFSALSESWIPWSDLAADVPYDNLLVGLIFRPGVHNRVNDLSTTFSIPADNLEFLEAMSVFTTDESGSLVHVPDDQLDGILAKVKVAQADAYRHIAKWSFADKVKNGAFVYFRGLMWPFTSLAGIDEEIDWSLPSEQLSSIWPIFAGGLPDADPDDGVGFPMFPRIED